MSVSNQNSRQAGITSNSVSAGLFAAIMASLCCITPVFSLLAGVGGIAATFSWMQPLRPYLIVLTIGLLSFAWHQKLNPRAKEEIECACEKDEKASFWQSKKFLGVVTVFAILMLAFPSYSGIFFLGNSNIPKVIVVKENDLLNAELHINGMTCTGCEHSVNAALYNSEGVIEASSSFKSGIASVKFDASKVSVDQLVSAIEETTGYKVTDKKVMGSKPKSE